VQTLDGGIALDPTHPASSRCGFYLNFFKSRGFDFLKWIS